MYMCKGNVKVSNKGVYRTVSGRMLKILVEKHLNKAVMGDGDIYSFKRIMMGYGDP
jgi:hypothetical protein